MVGASSLAPKGCRFDPQSGHIPGCGFDLWLGCYGRQPNRCFSLTSISLSLENISINISLSEDLKKHKTLFHFPFCVHGKKILLFLNKIK